MPEHAWIVHKFGGTSLADAKCFRRVAGILSHTGTAPQAVVVSAIGGLTDSLLDLVRGAVEQDSATSDGLTQVRERQLSVADDLLESDRLERYREAVMKDCSDISDILHSTRLLRSAAQRTKDVVAGYGELWSARLLSEFLNSNEDENATWLDARKVLVVDQGELGPLVNWEESAARFADALTPDRSGILVITGYIASDSEGLQTTLGRNGSDFSASVFGALLRSSEITIWTDVDGVMSADPRLVPDAAIIRSLSYSEAMELAYFGAKVLHPQTMAPAVEHSIPILIRNTFAPEEPGTRIGPAGSNNRQVKGITSIDQISLVNLEGAGMIGVPGTANRLFGALREARVSVVLISQGSSEHSICFAVPESDSAKVQTVVHEAFDREIREGQIQKLEVTPHNSILAVVGEGMTGMPGIAAKFFGTLGKAGVNVKAIAQGSSERNISAVIGSEDASRALRAVHAGFYLSPQTISIGLIGPGSIGSVFLDQLAGEVGRLSEEANLDLRIRGIMSSTRMLLAPRRIELQHWREHFEQEAVAADLDAFVDHIHADHLPHAVIVECTASDEVALHHGEWLGSGIHVVTPNKKANSGSWDDYSSLRARRKKAGSHYLYETNVGAGLPVIQTVRDLKETGDEIFSIEGIFSGTLAYLFNLFDGRRPFSEIVLEAKANGFTEPDPREDLSGMDVARKVIILGREMGLELELSDVSVESLVPEELANCSVWEYLDGLPRFDERMNRLLEEAQANGKVLRYVGRLSAHGAASVRLEQFDADHPFAIINLTDNILQYKTRRYSGNPLIIQGPGAGPDVTAAGVFADLLRLTSYLGATR